jgi:LPXTG-motif cell wall-anchored protein
MKRSDEARLPDDLEQIAARLTEHRIEVDELALDGVKQRVLARSRRTRRRGGFFLARLVTAVTTFLVVGVFGGAMALAQFDSHANSQGGAADAQYTSPVSAQSTSAQATAPSAASTSPARASSTLPFTGENVLTAFLLAALLVGAGLLLMQRSRRRE